MTINQKNAVHRNMASMDGIEDAVSTSSEPANTLGEVNPVFEGQVETTTVDEVPSVKTTPVGK